MIAFAVLALSVTFSGVVFGDDSFDQERAAHRVARAWNHPKLPVLAKYWQSYALLRELNFERCDKKSFVESFRKKYSQQVNVAKRSALQPAEAVRVYKAEAEYFSEEVNKCVQKKLAVNPSFHFDRQYQELSTEVDRLLDQIVACSQAGGSIDVIAKRSAFPVPVEGQLNPEMVENYQGLLREKAGHEADKEACFNSLEIPPGFPYSLEESA